MTKSILVLGKNFSTILGVIRSLGEAGYKLDVFFVSTNDLDKSIVRSSRYIRNFYGFSRREDQRILEKLLNIYKNPNEKVLLFPTDDYTAYLISEYRENLPEHFLHPGFPKDKGNKTIQLMNKYEQFLLAQKYNIPVARSWVLERKQQKWEIPKDIEYPCFIKPLKSYEGGKSGMIKCDDISHLKNSLALIESKNAGLFAIIAQQYIHIDEEFSISGICMDEKVYLPYLMKKELVCKSHPGTTAVGRLISMDTLGELKEQLAHMLSDLRYRGVVDVEVFRKGKQFYFNEINFRSSAVCYAVTAGGVNLPALYADAILSEQAISLPPAENYNKTFVCEKAVWEDFRNRYIKWTEVIALCHSADYHILENSDDPKPGKAFNNKKVHYFARHIVPKKY